MNLRKWVLDSGLRIEGSKWEKKRKNRLSGRWSNYVLIALGFLQIPRNVLVSVENF